MKTNPILLTTRDSKNVVVGGRGRREYNYSPLRHFIEDGSSQLCFPDEEPKADRGHTTYSRSPGSKTPHHIPDQSVILSLWKAHYRSISQSVKSPGHKSSGSVCYFKPGSEKYHGPWDSLLPLPTSTALLVPPRWTPWKLLPLLPLWSTSPWPSYSKWLQPHMSPLPKP